MTAGGMSPSSVGGAASAGGIGAAESIGSGGGDSVAQVNSNNTNINSNNTNIIQMSTQDFVALQSGCQSSGGAGAVEAMGGCQEGGLDLEKLLEMMVMMMIMKMMQEMMQDMATGGGMMGG